MTRGWAFRLIAVLLFVAAAAALALNDTVSEQLNRLLNWARELGVWGPVLFSVVYVFASVLFVPASWLTLGAGYAFGTVVGFVCALTGALLGASLSFFLGRTLARHIVERFVAKSRRFAAIDRAVGEDGFKIVLLMRLTPALPFAPLNYGFGVSRVRFRDYFFASLLGMFPGALVYTYLGWVTQNVTGMAMGEVERSPAQWALLAIGLLAAIAVSVVITRLARRALREAAVMEDAVMENE